MKLFTKISPFMGKLFAAVSYSPKLRALVAAGVTGVFTFIGLNIDAETCLALVGAAFTLAGWGPAGALESEA